MCLSSILGLVILLIDFLNQPANAFKFSDFRPQHGPSCWQLPYTPDCSVYGMNASDPGVTGNLAFFAFYNPILPQRAEVIVEDVKHQLEPAWKETTKPIDFHITISYLYCVPQMYTEPIRSALRSLVWDSFSVTVDHVMCEKEGPTGWIEMGVDSTSQMKLGNFSRRLQDHLIAHNIPVPNLDVLQTPMHITIGVFNASYPIAHWHLPEFGLPVMMQVDSFYLGETIYASRDFIDSGGLSTWIIVVIVLAIVIICGLLGFRIYKSSCCSRAMCPCYWTAV